MFDTFKGEKVNFDFYAAKKPSQKHAGLADPEGHSETTSLPVMYRERSTLASQKSKISFNGIEYKIPVLIKVPIFFTGMKGYYSEEFSLGVFRTISKELKIISLPGEFSEGQANNGKR